jgi:hypothetical protein
MVPRFFKNSRTSVLRGFHYLTLRKHGVSVKYCWTAHFCKHVCGVIIWKLPEFSVVSKCLICESASHIVLCVHSLLIKQTANNHKSFPQAVCWRPSPQSNTSNKSYKYHSDIDAYSFNIHPFQVRISLRSSYLVLVLNRSVRLYTSNNPRTDERIFVNSGNGQFY